MTLENACLVDLPHVQDERGSLSFIEAEKHIPFEIRRVYYLYGVMPGASRGAHAHKELQQLMVALAGSLDVELDDGHRKLTFHLTNPTQGLYVPSGLWRDLRNFTPDAVCLVLASMHYSEDDYYRDYQDYLSVARSKG